MAATTETEPYFRIVSAPSPADFRQTVSYALSSDSFQVIAEAGMRTVLAQFLGIVVPGMADTIHLFKGLQRPLYDGADMGADASILAYTFEPDYDVMWIGDGDGRLELLPPPPNRVFVALVKPFREPDSHGVGGLIEHWSWVQKDHNLQGAPVGHKNRYLTRVWSR